MTITQNPNYLGGCDFGFTGHFTRAALVAGRTELVLTHFRAYDPELGRWLSEDPLGVGGGLNSYAYCIGNPLIFRDPDGQLPEFFHGWIPGTPGYTWGEYFGEVGDVALGQLKGAAENLSFGLYEPCYEGALQRIGGTQGDYLATGATLITGAGVGLAVGKKAAGAGGKKVLSRLRGNLKDNTDFSHFVPHRMMKAMGSRPGNLLNKLEYSMLNGNVVPYLKHVAHDKTLVTSSLVGRSAGDVMGLGGRIVSRFPRAVAGTGAGAGVGLGFQAASHAMRNGCP